MSDSVPSLEIRMVMSVPGQNIANSTQPKVNGNRFDASLLLTSVWQGADDGNMYVGLCDCMYG